MILALEVTDVLFLGRIKEKVADRSNEGVDTEGDGAENEVSPRSGGVAFGLEGGVVDDNAANPTEEEGKKETDELVVVNGIVVHDVNHLSYNMHIL